jgi:biotin carboxyl carrier protein
MRRAAAYRVSVGGRAFDVTIEPDGDSLLVRVGDRAQPAGWYVRGRYERTLAWGAAHRNVLVAPAEAPATAGVATSMVALEGYQAGVEVQEARALRLAAALPRRAATLGRVEVRAPMPGRVAAVRVAVGAAVERGTLLAILEAMKMENELRAPQAGRVAELRVQPGDAVERGALLLVLEPPPAT